MMVNSSMDMLAFTARLNSHSIPNVAGMIHKGDRRIPVHYQKLMITARELHHRFSQGDYRHERREAGKIVELSRWLQSQYASYTKTGEHAFEVNMDAFEHRGEMLPAGSYAAAHALVEQLVDQVGQE